ncbi:hypothetical protein FD16_GL000920 [Paucilactobacillus suebicus DSM 5007 = KCTC 3549]|uniref:Uncharacterized protein n=2 Tax=Paucilactobacillus suebicus TaxID=152335 RepID=A0A0R1W7V5_9LACO|nr:hypothetical protein FD16_GL000920 [Paucilactobacillus suebicus DSM 5007 = KCTC 3549]
MVFEQLSKTVTKMRAVRMSQVLFDFAMIYGIICVVMGGARVVMFNQTFIQNDAMIVVLLISVADLCLAVIRRNYRSQGIALSKQLTGRLSDQEAQLIQALKRF